MRVSAWLPYPVSRSQIMVRSTTTVSSASMVVENSAVPPPSVAAASMVIRVSGEIDTNRVST